ncbi:MAG: hypothetical protein Q8Q62_08140 [Mesorhizobium sp.]|nr:hypothetical protein [Mesorhizobium sp.]
MFEKPKLFAASRAGVAALLLMAGIPLAAAQVFPSGRDSGFNERDAVTGYLCVTPGCDVLRLPEANCLCVKDNPAERRLSRLKLTCSKRQAGAWVACPVKPKYGN